MGKFQHFDSKKIGELHEAALDLGIGDADLSALLGSIAPSFVATLPHGTTPSSRLLATLNHLNRIEALVDGSVPMEQLLAAVIAVHSQRTETKVIKNALALLRSRGQRSQPHKQLPLVKPPIPSIKPPTSSIKPALPPVARPSPPHPSLRFNGVTAWVAALAVAGILVVALLLPIRDPAPSRGQSAPPTTTATNSAPVAASTVVPPKPASSRQPPAKCEHCELARIPKGKLKTLQGEAGGSLDDKIIPEFYINVTEVAVTDYKRCVEASACSRPATVAGCNYDSGRDHHPVNCVTWSQANSYCEWNQQRLPTEDEWKLAARGSGSQPNPYPWGRSKPNEIGAICWNQENITCAVDRDYNHDRTPVSSPRQTDLAVVDLGGNVSEWTSTLGCRGDSAACAKHVVLGSSAQKRDVGVLDADLRGQGVEDTTPPQIDIGFRCAKDP